MGECVQWNMRWRIVNGIKVVTIYGRCKKQIIFHYPSLAYAFADRFKILHRFLLKYLESIRKRKIGHAWQHADFPRELIALRFRCLIYAPLRIQNYVLNRGRARFLCKQVYNEPHFAFAKNAHYATEFMCFPWRHSRIAATFEVSSTSLAPRIVVLVAVAL